MVIGNAIGIPFGWGSGMVSLPYCIQDNSIAWWKDFNDIESIIGPTTIDGLLNFDGIDDYVELSASPVFTGDLTVSFKTYMPDTIFGVYNNALVLEFMNSTSNESFSVNFYNPDGDDVFLNIGLNDNNNKSAYQFFISESDITYLNTEVDIIITASNGIITSVSINGDSSNGNITISSPSTITYDHNYIGRGITSHTNSLVWDVNINDQHHWQGQPAGNTDTAWLDTIGSINGTVYGSPTTIDIPTTSTTNYIEESIGKRTDTIYYGQYLDATSGQIDFKRSSGTFDYTDPSDGLLVEGVSIPGDGLYTIPANGICEIGVYPRDIINSVEGVLDFDGSSYVVLDSHPNVEGNKVITFGSYFETYTTTAAEVIFIGGDNPSDFLEIVYISNLNRLRVGSGTNKSSDFSLTGYMDKPVSVEITKTSSTAPTVKIDGVSLVIDISGASSQGVGTLAAFGYHDNYPAGSILEHASIWDFEIEGENIWVGQPAGNTDAAWVDTISGNNGSVVGSPSIKTISETPTTIGDSEYSSLYPICETAGTVLHDTKGDSLHITIDSPVWSESLYGSDYLNQNGYFIKAESDALGYNWETDINGTPVTLHDNTLVPFGDWAYELLYDSNGEIVYDSNSEPIYVKINL